MPSPWRVPCMPYMQRYSKKANAQGKVHQKSISVKAFMTCVTIWHMSILSLPSSNRKTMKTIGNHDVKIFTGNIEDEAMEGFGIKTAK